MNASKKLSLRYDVLSIMDEIGKYDHKRVVNQLGTLGGGNHFIEICLDESNVVWVMLHSGSRNIGKTIGETAIHMAREIAEREERGLRDKDLAWLDEGSKEFDTRCREFNSRTRRHIHFYAPVAQLVAAPG